MAAAIDLADNMGNAARGLHMAAMGGLWQAAVMGFAGIRRRGEALAVEPALPPELAPLQRAARGSAARASRSRCDAGVAAPARCERLGITVEEAPVRVVLNGKERTLSSRPTCVHPQREGPVGQGQALSLLVALGGGPGDAELLPQPAASPPPPAGRCAPSTSASRGSRRAAAVLAAPRPERASSSSRRRAPRSKEVAPPRRLGGGRGRLRRPRHARPRASAASPSPSSAPSTSPCWSCARACRAGRPPAPPRRARSRAARRPRPPCSTPTTRSALAGARSSCSTS